LAVDCPLANPGLAKLSGECHFLPMILLDEIGLG
jgi:hypothetical protein